MKKIGLAGRVISLVLAILCVTAVCAPGISADEGSATAAEKYAAHTPLNLWGDTIPYNNMGKNTTLIPKITPYIAADNPNGLCAVIYPGGGYSFVSMDKEGHAIAQYLNTQGISAFVVNYRMTDSGARAYDYRAILSDGLRAVKYVRYNAEEFEIDPDRIFTIGFSAGGHLTTMSATHFDFQVDDPNYTPDEIDAVSARPDAAAPSYAVTTICESYTHSGTANNFSGGNRQLKIDYSGENSVTENTPPIFLWHTWNDTTVPIQNSIGFAAALAEKNIPCELHIYGQGNHGLGLAATALTAKNWPELLVEWANRTLVTE